ncbi:MAG: hypothetical protein MSK63_07195 [Clostridiales bacterium]|nr:hypothetical protein [Clostridiales bacterium]
MSKKAYAVLNGITKKIRKNYAVIGGTTRKLRRGYVVLNGITRPFWTGGEAVYYGADNIYAGAQDPAYASTTKRAIFHSGLGSGSDPTQYMTAFDATLVKTTQMISRRYQHAGGCIGKFAVFAGGRRSASSSDVSSTTEAFDEALASVDCPSLRKGRCKLAGANAGSYLVFSGGETVSGAGSSTHRDTAYGDAYTESLTKVSVDMSVEERIWCGATLPSHALFAKKSVANAFNSSLTRSLPASPDADISQGTELHGKAMFADGSGNLQVYNSDLTKTVASGLSSARISYGCTTLDEWAIFAGGRISGGAANYQTSVEAFDDELTRITLTALSNGRYNLSGAHVGDFAFFAGGYTSDKRPTSLVDIYRI